jgi:membrane-associated phospholipid phosphatase
MSDSGTDDVALKSVRPATTPATNYVLPAGFTAAALAVFAVLSAQVAGGRPSRWDVRLSLYLYRSSRNDGRLDRVGDVLVWMLTPTAQVLAAAALVGVVVVLARGRRLRDAVLLVAAVAGTLLLERILKDAIKRPPFRPPDSGYSFPSGHAMASAAALAALVVVTPPSRWRWSAAIVAAVLCCGIGIALVYDGWHWASDVLGGWCVAVAWVSVLCLVLRPPRRSSRLRNHPFGG